MGFKKTLKEALKTQLNEGQLELLPSGFQTLGDLIIIKLNENLLEKKIEIGNAYLKLMPHIRSVYINSGKVSGKFRTPEGVKYLVGVDDPVVEHKEHGVTYKFDITKIMFSMGNLHERKLLTTFVKENEIIIDMFAGIGYFSLPIAKHSKAGKIYSIELNPIAFNYLVHNIRKNHFEDIIEPIHGDSKEEVLKLRDKGIRADRVIMGVFPAPIEFIQNALQLTKQEGTIFHYEGVKGEGDYPSLFDEFKNITKSEGFRCELISKRFVKSYGPKLFHIVIDISVQRIKGD